MKKKTNHETQLTLGADSYMFRHQGAIPSEFSNNKLSQNQSLQVRASSYNSNKSNN
jgi:hypothetical protein